ncbi:MAG: AraC family transcriptional regulator [Oscillibacter sp.]|jgi:AraC-like DNA-binding protein|uniref:AraC family transcriptional regulator n=1 Tax=uncultured Oscillibacter sp. TaxID=876091 RepID=UPI00216BEA39|nr:AraC family transcriptional regulator [uncultured Oscillibacter sp.]MCI9643348.1 AraC family transcriptional regulator [Oscillibacter sp.]
MEESYVLHLQKQYQKFSDFYLCYCGHARCEPLHSYGPAVRPNYLLHYILEGSGVYHVEDQEFSLQKGEGFLIEPNKQTFYQASEEDPWTYLWIGFDGAKCGSCLRSLGLGEGRLTFRCEDGGELLKLVESMLAYNKSDTEADFMLQSLLCRFFACLAKGISREPERRLTKRERENLYIHQAMEYIRNNYANGITVADVASYVALNRSYLFTLFRRVLGVSPQECLAQFRLTRAKEQLTLTDASVANIAMSCGYQDPQVFSKAFKQQFGITPVKYRKWDRERALRSLEHLAGTPEDGKQPVP